MIDNFPHTSDIWKSNKIIWIEYHENENITINIKHVEVSCKVLQWWSDWSAQHQGDLRNNLESGQFANEIHWLKL